MTSNIYKHIISLLLLLVASIGPVSAQIPIGSLYYYLDNYSKTATVISNPNGKYAGDITIPSTVEYAATTYIVTVIGWGAFSECTELTSVSIPESIEEIEQEAFYGCTSLPVIDNLRYADTYLVEAVDKSLTSYTIREGTKWIGSRTFANCNNLAFITLPNSVYGIGNQAFTCCYSLTSISIPSGVTRIYSQAFRDCINLTAINVDQNNPQLSSIDGVVFNKEQTHLVLYPCGKCGAYSIPNGVTDIDNDAFFTSCVSDVTIPTSVLRIGASAFWGCQNLSPSITIPSSVVSIERWAFEDCTNLMAINVDADNLYYSSVDGVLHNKDTTTLIRCPEGRKGEYSILPSVTLLDWEAFYRSRLNTITVPASVTAITNVAFTDCHNLTSVIMEGETPPTLDEYVFWGSDKAIIYVPCGTVDVYKAAWPQYKSRILPYGSEVTEYASFCEGSSFTWPNHFLKDGVTPMTFSVSGIYKDTLIGQDGCDSICVLHLSQSDPTDSIEVVTICAGGAHTWHGQTYTSTTSFTETIPNAAGCDSVCTLQLTVLPALTGDTSVIVPAGSSFTWHGTSYSTAGDYPYTYTSKVAPYCDSIVTLHLSVTTQLDYDIHTHSQCADDPYLEFEVEPSEGVFLQFQFTFNQSAKEQHFRDTIVDYSASPILIPNSARAGIYDVAISPVFNGEVLDKRNIQFTLLYPSSVLEQQWDDCIAVLTNNYNGGYDFVRFQWYKNGQPLLGENRSYLYQPLEIGAAYAALLEEPDGTKFMTCELIATPQTDISVYPTLLQPQHIIRLLCEQDVSIRLYDSFGKLLFTNTFTPGDHHFPAPQATGVYILHIQSSGPSSKSETKKLIVR